MRTSAETINLIKNFEGFRSVAYLCPSGYKTIGYGHLLTKNENIESINRNDAENLLYHDIKMVEQSIYRNIKAALTQGQFDALASFTFNLGGAALQRSTLRQKVNRLEHEDVPREFMRWIYAGGVALAGLIKRREVEAEMYAG